MDRLDEMRVLFRQFERVAGAHLNEAKTTAIDVGVTDNPLVVEWIRLNQNTWYCVYKLRTVNGDAELGD